MSASSHTFPKTQPAPDVLGELLHSLSQPLTSLRCALELELELEPTLAESTDEVTTRKFISRQHITRQQKSTAHALEQTESVIGMIQLMREYLDAEYSGQANIRTALAPILRNLAEELESIAAVCGVDLSVVGNCSATLPMSEARMRLALQYLIAASIDTQPTGGRVTLRLEEDRAEALLRVEAVSGGRDPNFQAPSSIPTLRKAKLAIARRVFETAGATLEFGGGAGDFILRIPRRVSLLFQKL